MDNQRYHNEWFSQTRQSFFLARGLSKDLFYLYFWRILCASLSVEHMFLELCWNFLGCVGFRDVVARFDVAKGRD